MSQITTTAKPKVLIVDDRREGLLALHAILSSMELEILQATSGEMALEILMEQEQDFAAILLDVIMPEIGGFEVAQLLRENDETAQIPIIFLTASDRTDELVGEGYSRGAVDILFKPINPMILRSKVSVFAELHSRTKALQAAEHELLMAQKMQAIGHLAGGVAHEVNNTLTSVMGHAQLLQESLATNSPDQELVREILLGSERVARLTSQLLAFGRRKLLRPLALDLNSQVADIGGMLTHLVRADIHLVTSFRPGLTPVKVDPGALQEVIVNLVVNARDAVPEGGRIEIETSEVSGPDGRFAVLTVSDSGYGMDDETVSHIFEPFFTTKLVGEGPGLGLSTVYGILEQSGGRIEVKSAPGSGSTFTVYLPTSEEEIEATASAPTTPEGSTDGDETILIVEDEEKVRRLLRIVLESKGYMVLEARHGREALEMTDQHSGQIHMVVTDVVMPEMGGRELMARLKSVCPEAKVLYVSGYPFESLRVEGAIEASAPFLGKPFAASDLTRMVRQGLDAPAGAGAVAD